MEKLLSYLPIITLCIGGWALVNGILHDVFILLSEHGKKYDRNLLRLLMDGHILITCGVVQILCYYLLKTNNPIGNYIALAASISLLIYCAMIFPFLKSALTILLNLGLTILLFLKLGAK
ncbi:MAG: hypothetical protein NTX03_03230 [Bacteroidetes bacterium]|nr:hypothetical protein [Bacteroidota bacterium]